MSANFNELVKEGGVIAMYDFDPNATTTTDISWVDMRDYDRLLVGFFRTIGTSDLTFSLIGNTASNGGGTDVTLKTKTLTSVQPDAVGDYTFLEISADEIVAASESGARYVSANMAFATSTDEGVVLYIRTGAKYPQTLTADVIA